MRCGIPYVPRKLQFHIVKLTPLKKKIMDFSSRITSSLVNPSLMINMQKPWNTEKVLVLNSDSLFSQVEVIVSPSGGMPNVLSEEIIRGPMSGWDPYLQDFDWHFTTLPNLAGTPASNNAMRGSQGRSTSRFSVNG